MIIVLVVLMIFVMALLIMAAAIEVQPSVYSVFELERRHHDGDEATAGQRERMQYFDDLVSLQRIAIAFFLTISVMLFVAVWGWLIGGLGAIALALGYGAAARLDIIHRHTQRLYERYEPTILRQIQRFPKIMAVVRTLKTTQPEPVLHSQAELLDLVTRADKTVLSQNERMLLASGLAFGDRKVSEVMTPRSVVDTIKKSEILGPLVLDDLHKTGHNRFPVVDGDLDHVVGILLLRNALVLDTTKHRTAKVEKAMDPNVYYIKEDQTLEHALTAFLKTHHHLFVVVNEYRETVGILSLEDVIESLLGRTIVDEFDAHDDLRAVAMRNPRRNNVSLKSTDV